MYNNFFFIVRIFVIALKIPLFHVRIPTNIDSLAPTKTEYFP